MTAKKGERSKKSKTVPSTQIDKKSISFSQVKEFIADVKAEFGKIVWPDKKVTFGSTGVVIVLVIVISIYLGAVDLLIGKIVSYILK